MKLTNCPIWRAKLQFASCLKLAAVIICITFLTKISVKPGTKLWCEYRYRYENLPVLDFRIEPLVERSNSNGTVIKDKIAIGCAITTRGLEVENSLSENSNALYKWGVVNSMPFFQQLLPSFCKTASRKYSYTFFIAYDSNDPWMTDSEFRDIFQLRFSKTVSGCSSITSNLKVSQSNHINSPASAQNDVMMMAYRDPSGMDYFYRVNDDTTLSSPGWTEAFILALKQFTPPLVGVVGPFVETPTGLGGNPMILSYDFVHRTHVDIFGFYYPEELTTWFADDWISHVYQPRALRISNIKVLHTMSLKSRYKADQTDKTLKLLENLIISGRSLIDEWLLSFTTKS